MKMSNRWNFECGKHFQWTIWTDAGWYSMKNSINCRQNEANTHRMFLMTGAQSNFRFKSYSSSLLSYIYFLIWTSFAYSKRTHYQIETNRIKPNQTELHQNNLSIYLCSILYLFPVSLQTVVLMYCYCRFFSSIVMPLIPKGLRRLFEINSNIRNIWNILKYVKYTNF